MFYMNTATVADMLTRSSGGIFVAPEQIIEHGASGYSVEGIVRRDSAVNIAAAIMAAFAGDPEAGLPEIAVRAARYPDEQPNSFYVRVVIDH